MVIIMWLDKYLKVFWLIKRCIVVKEVVEKGCIVVNGVMVKLGINVKFGDELVICFGFKIVIVKIECLEENVKKE